MSVLRVGFDGRVFRSPARGVRRYGEALVHALHEVAPDILLIMIAARPEGPAWVGAPLVSEQRVLPTNLGRNLAGLPLALRRSGADVFHAPSYTGPLWSPLPVVLTIHDVSYASHPEWYPYKRDPVRRAFYRLAAARADAILTISEFSRTEICSVYGLPAERVHVVPLGVGPPFGPTSSAPGDAGVATPFVLHVGDLHRRRNLRVALQAVQRLRRRGGTLGRLTLCLAGADGGEVEALQRESADDTGALTWLGVVSDARLASLYAAAAALVYPSRYEGFGLPVLEAMACGVPVVASTAGAIPEVAGDAAKLADPDDVDGFEAALAEVLTDPVEAQRLRCAGTTRAAGFTWARTATQTARVYRACARRR